MGSENKEKWLLKLKDSVQNHSEQLPDNFWEELEKDIPAAVPVTRRRPIGRYIWAVSAAAVLILAAILFVPADEDSEVQEYVARQEQVQSDILHEEVPRETDIPDGEEDIAATGEDVPEVVVSPAESSVRESAAARVAVKERNLLQEGVDILLADKEERDIEPQFLPQEKEDTVAVEDADVHGKERDEYLKELEYLREDEGRTRERKRSRLAFAGGSNAGFPKSGMETSPSVGAVRDPNNGVQGEAGTPEPPLNNSTIGGFVSLDYDPVDKIVWIGENVPFIFKETPAYRSYGYDHKTPVRFAVSFAREVAPGIYLESGLSYQYLRSTMQSSGGITQKLHYLGIPLRVSASLLGRGGFSLYASAGYMVEKCVYGELEDKYNHTETLNLKELQHSLNGYLGLQLGLGAGASVYIEPGIYHYLGMKDKELGRQHGYIIGSIYTENPTGFSFQGGLRFTF